MTAASAGSSNSAALADLLGNSSIEISLRESGHVAEAARLLPAGCCVYVPALPGRPLAQVLPVLAEIRAQGLDPVPHVAARRVTARAELEDFLGVAVAQHGVHRVMLIGGDEDAPRGPWRDSMELMASGMLAAAGVRELGIAVYPEGHPKIAQTDLWRAFDDKQRLAREQRLGLYAVTQFSFAPERMLALLAELAHRAAQMPVYLGLPGPSDPLALMRYAQRCGVGAARRALSTLGTGIAKLVAHTEPAEQLAAAVHYAQGHPNGNLVGVHVFSFGGVLRSARWISERMQTASAIDLAKP